MIMASIPCRNCKGSGPGRIKTSNMNIPTKCCGIVGWLFGHHYVPRFNYVDRPRDLCQWTTGTLKESTKTYIMDVCTRCGAVTIKETNEV